MAFFSPIEEGELESGLYSSLEADDREFTEYQPIEYDVPEEWISLLGETKGLEDEYHECNKKAFLAKREIARKYDNIEVMRSNIPVLAESSLKDDYAALLEKYEIELNIVEEMTNIRKLLGKRNALKKVLRMDKHEEILACPICCEAKVEKFIDPCGHTFCEPCLLRGAPTEKCPICRTKVKQVRQLFFS